MAGWGTWTGSKPLPGTASGSGTIGQNGNWTPYKPPTPSADDLLAFFQGVAGTGAGGGYGGYSRGGYGGGGGGGFAEAPQQIDPLDLQAWDAQLALQRKATDLAISQQPQQWRDSLQRLKLQNRASQQQWATTRHNIALGRTTSNREYGENLGQLYSDATARGAFTSRGTQQGEKSLADILGEQMRGFDIQYRAGLGQRKNEIGNLKLDRRELSRQRQRDLLNIDTMKNQLWFDALARNQVQGQIGGQAIPYINVPGSAGKVIHFGGIGMNF